MDRVGVGVAGSFTVGAVQTAAGCAQTAWRGLTRLSHNCSLPCSDTLGPQDMRREPLARSMAKLRLLC